MLYEDLYEHRMAMLSGWKSTPGGSQWGVFRVESQWTFERQRGVLPVLADHSALTLTSLDVALSTLLLYVHEWFEPAIVNRCWEIIGG